jgi:hypothetical protein
MVRLDTLEPPRFDNTNAKSFVMIPYLILSGIGLLAYNLLQPDASVKLQEGRFRALPSYNTTTATAPRTNTFPRLNGRNVA